MEDFEYSVEICDRDWECFFEECEECNVLPPSLAGLEDSGMSDVDDAGSILLKKAQSSELFSGLTETKHPVDSPPECEGSPVELYLSKHSLGGVSSILSGSEEDLHLQSINIFFENVNGFTEMEPHNEADQHRVGRNREERPKEECCDIQQQATGSTLPKNIPKRKSVPVSGEAAFSEESTSHVNTIGNISSPFTFSNSQLQTDKSGVPATFVSEEANAENRAKAPLSRPHDFLDSEICCDSMAHTYSEEMHKPLAEAKQMGSLLSATALGKNCHLDWTEDPKVLSDFKEREEKVPLISDVWSMSRAVGQEFSPSASVRRRRRRKRRPSVETSEGEHGCEKLSDSEEERLEEALSLRFSEVVTGLSKRTSKDRETDRSSDAAFVQFTQPAPAKKINSYDLPQTLPLCVGQCQELKVELEDSFALSDISGTDERVNFIPQTTTDLQTRDEIKVTQSARNSFLTEKLGKRDNQMKGGTLAHHQLSKSLQHCFNPSENEAILQCQTAEVKSMNLVTSEESNALDVDAFQNVKLSLAKSGLAAEPGNNGSDAHTTCPKQAEPHQQSAPEPTHRVRTNSESTPIVSDVKSGIASSPVDTKLGQIQTMLPPSLERILHDSPSRCKCSSPSQLSLPFFNEKELNERPLLNTQKTRETESTENNKVSQVSIHNNPKESSQSEGFLGSLSDITCVSSLCTLDTQSARSLSNETVSDLSASFCSNVSEQESDGQEEKLPEPEELGGCTTSEPRSNHTGGAHDAAPVSKSECDPGKGTSSLFAMSSFWKDMEKLTINDILALRMKSSSAPPNSLPQLQEGEEMDSGFFNQLDEPRPHVTSENAFTALDVANPDLCSVIDNSSARNISWQSEILPSSQSVGIYSETLPLTSVVDVTHPLLHMKPEKGPNKLSKNVSMQNLHSLETRPFIYQQKEMPLQDLDAKLDEHDCFEERFVQNPKPTRTSLTSSLTDIFQFLFGQKQSAPTHAAPDDVSPVNTDGKSVAETYDHFFSEFDTESFFYPFIANEEKVANRQIPIYSCSRSANKYLQFPEAYEHFFQSSSSDDSSAESDEEDGCRPVSVVTRFSRKASSTNICSDIYDNFFTDRDLKQNFFWRTTFSFRNLNFTTSTTPKKMTNSLSCMPARGKGSPHPRLLHQLNALGNPDALCPDPLLYHWEDKVTRQIAQRPFPFEDLQTAVLNPRLDAPFLPLRHSDMCLVCIAFASWVLKTANPDAGDAWKAVLLANVSALSAIRYLRKYVKVEASSSEAKLRDHALTES